MAHDSGECPSLKSSDDLQRQLAQFYRLHCRLYTHFYDAGLDTKRFFQPHFKKLNEVGKQICQGKNFNLENFLSELEQPIQFLQDWLKKYRSIRKVEQLSQKLKAAELYFWDFNRIDALNQEIALHEQRAFTLTNKVEQLRDNVISGKKIRPKIAQMIIRIFSRRLEGLDIALVKLKSQCSQARKRLSKTDYTTGVQVERTIKRLTLTIKLIRKWQKQLFGRQLEQVEKHIYDMPLRYTPSQPGISKQQWEDANQDARKLVKIFATLVNQNVKVDITTTRCLIEQFKRTVRQRAGSLSTRSSIEDLVAAHKNESAMEDNESDNQSPDAGSENDSETETDKACSFTTMSTSTSKESVESRASTLNVGETQVNVINI